MELQRLVWLCRPMCEWQFLPHMMQMKLDEGRVKLLLQPTSLQLSGDVSHLLSRFPLSLSISGSHNHQRQLPSCWDQFHNASLNRKVGRMSFLTDLSSTVHTELPREYVYPLSQKVSKENRRKIEPNKFPVFPYLPT